MSAIIPPAATILAGPIVRRVSPDSAAFWLALPAPASVVVDVRDRSSGDRVAEGACDTIAFGERLHVALLRARGTMRWGGAYSYSLSGLELDSDALVYPAQTLPSFVIPPTELDRLRIVHGSCRLPHGEGVDALAGLDTLLARREPESRPHHLLLSGDQVYVNNIAPEWLAHLTGLGDQLLGYQELLPGVDAPCSAFPTGTREALIRDHGGLLEYGDDSHLLGFGEICALYLLSLSPTLWPRELAETRRGRQMQVFLATLPAVRRALANISVLTIFDDHEVTDDWNLTLHWVTSVLSRPLGRRIVCNALCAYAVFQGWGNDPDAFEDGAGRALLSTLASWRGEQDVATELEALVGLPSVDEVLSHNPPQLGTRPGAVSWGYRYRGPRYELLVPDQRMCRSFPGQRETDPPVLLSDRAMNEQLRDHASDQPIVFLLSSSALLPIPKPWYLRSVVWLTEHLAAWRHNRDPHYADVYGPDRGDGWDVESAGFQRLLSALSETCRAGKVVVLAGDIHLGSAARVYYTEASQAAAISGQAQGRRELVLAHLTSSPLRKEHSGTRLAQRIGYRLLGRPPLRCLPAPAASESNGPTIVIEHLAGDKHELVGTNHLAEVRLVEDEDGMHVVSDAWWGQPLEVRNRFRVPLGS